MGHGFCCSTKRVRQVTDGRVISLACEDDVKEDCTWTVVGDSPKQSTVIAVVGRPCLACLREGVVVDNDDANVVARAFAVKQPSKGAYSFADSRVAKSSPMTAGSAIAAATPIQMAGATLSRKLSPLSQYGPATPFSGRLRLIFYLRTRSLLTHLIDLFPANFDVWESPAARV
jgi:hypothetical protein